MNITNRSHFIFPVMIFIFFTGFTSAAQVHGKQSACMARGSVGARISIKHTTGRNNSKTGIYSDANHESLFFTGSKRRNKSYQFFLFNMDGALIRQSRLSETETEKLTEIEKGNYFFEVFNGDERIENGSIAIR